MTFRDGALDLSPEEQALRTAVAQAGAEIFQPLAEAWGEKDELNWDLARALGQEGLFPLLVPVAYGGSLEGPFRSVTLCLAREELARTCPAAEELFAIQGLGSYPILLAGSDAQKQRWLPLLARGEMVPAFALTEPEAGSDAAAVATRAERQGDQWVLTGAKRFISNAPGPASTWCSLGRARSPAPKGSRPSSSRVTPPGSPAPPCTPSPPMSSGSCDSSAAASRGSPAWRRGCRLADRDGNARRLPRLGGRAGRRPGAGRPRPGDRPRAATYQFGQPIAQFQMIQAKLADMATELRAARLLVYSAARLKDAGAARVTLESSMAKLFATEMAQRVVDQAVQIHGGAGVLRGSPIERLYREVRAPRIYEGTSEIQRLIIARQLLRDAETGT